MLIITSTPLMIINICFSIQTTKTSLKRCKLFLRLLKSIATNKIQMKNTIKSMTTIKEERIILILITRELHMSVQKIGDQRIISRKLIILIRFLNIQNGTEERNLISMTRLYYQQIKREAIFTFISHPLLLDKTKLKFIITKTILLMQGKLCKFQ